MEPWDKQVESALRSWLLDRIEDRSLWYDRDRRPTPRSVAQLADILDRNEEFRDVLRLWAGDPNAATGTALAKLLADEAVPFFSAYRYQPSGLDKRADWEHTWALQRREDAGEKLDSPIPVPPKYKPTDFANPPLVTPRQARRPQGTVHLLPQRRTRHRRHRTARLGRLGPRRPSIGLGRTHQRAHRRGLGHNTADPLAGGST